MGVNIHTLCNKTSGTTDQNALVLKKPNCASTFIHENYIEREFV